MGKIELIDTKVLLEYHMKCIALDLEYEAKCVEGCHKGKVFTRANIKDIAPANGVNECIWEFTVTRT
ncbi:hypothetical protein I532_04155 [Brevibacillus borstelensis AK1]|uniref:Uncharacterized protein n=1 Tax=Brevibacillus borstelensis AK1 TaxID=1300222 RepID=M8DEJ7_9BACL|nr:hypothetical protein I532_04155 [Brevibacillus borstelensis AK1]